MIQLRRIRHVLAKGFPDGRTTEKPTEPQLECENIARLFAEREAYIEKLAPSERYNIFYTLGMTDGDYHRSWAGQDVIPFDIDGVVDEAGHFDENSYLETIFGVLGVDRSKCLSVASGNGIQILVQPSRPITDKGFFRIQRGPYERLCEEIAGALSAAGLRFKEVDPSSFALNRIFRLPGTENRKPGRPVRHARFLGGELEPQPFHIQPTGGKDDPLEVQPKSQLTVKQLAFFAIDTPAVEAGCRFLQWAKANPAELNEPQWYAMLGVVGRLEDGRQKAHAYSVEHRGYTEQGTDRKLDQALAASGPRTCENIDHIWGDCHTCPNFKKVASPVSLKSETFVATEKSGFHLLGKNGGLQPQYEDLRRYFEREHPYRSHEKSGIVYVWEEKKYMTWSDTQLRSYAHDKFDPKPQDFSANEFKQWVNRTHLIEVDWFRDSTRGFINFANGILDTTAGILGSHSPDRGFLYVLPFDYDPAAACPVFDKFMTEVTMGDTLMETMMLEFLGYAICDRDYWLQKSLLLIGEGSNGKSTFLKIAEELAGKENASHLSLNELQSDTSRSMLEGKLLNISDELPNYSIKSTELLKKLFGGTMTMRRLYHDGMTVENTAKFIFAGNSIPATTDVSEGLFRRLVIVPFDAHFSQGGAGPKAADSTLVSRMKAELPGIFNRVFGHYKTLKKRGHLIESQRSTAELARYREEVDRVGSWTKDNLYWNGSWSDEAPKVELTSVFERYVSDCKRGEERPTSKFHFTKQLRRHIDHWDERYGRQRSGKERPYILKGVEFRKENGPKEHF